MFLVLKEGIAIICYKSEVLPRLLHQCVYAKMMTSEHDDSPLSKTLIAGVDIPETPVDFGSSASRSPQTLASPASLSRRSSFSVTDAVPSWAREIAISTQSRPSRASSIISTHTKTSISTLDAPQSIDVILGRESFRIAREGSLINITRDEIPAPPYDAPFVPAASITWERSGAPAVAYQTPRIADNQAEPPAPAYDSVCNSDIFNGRGLDRSVPPSHGEPDHTPSALIVYEGQETDSAPPSSDDVAGVSRSPSYNPGKENLSVNWRRTSSSSMPTGESPQSPKARLRRRNGVRLKLETRTSGEALGQDASPISPGSGVSSSTRTGYTHSAGTTPDRGDDISGISLPLLTGKEAAELLPSMAPRSAEGSACDRQLHQTNIIALDPPYIDQGFVETVPPPSMDTEDEIKVHYNRLLRTIDRNYRKELHARDEDMSKLRERINEIDQVYRMELRARDQEMEDRLQAREKDLNEMHERVRTLEQQDLVATDRARHEVEDMWEVRWKDRDRHLMERMRKIELENQENIEKALAEKNEKWVADWAKRNKELLDRLRKAEGQPAWSDGTADDTSFLYSLRL